MIAPLPPDDDARDPLETLQQDVDDIETAAADLYLAWRPYVAAWGPTIRAAERADARAAAIHAARERLDAALRRIHR